MNRWRGVFSEIFVRFSAFRRTAAIDTVDAFEQFLADRAAFVAQKKLYEYVKVRMGLTYPDHFAKDAFIASLNIAKWRVYAACLSDLALWMAARLHAAGATADETLALARAAHDRAIATRFSADEMQGDLEELKTAFADRAALANFSILKDGENAFSLSPKELVRWAPISDELKRYDTEIVINSLRFAWLAIRQDFNDAIRPREVVEDWRKVNGEW